MLNHSHMCRVVDSDEESSQSSPGKEPRTNSNGQRFINEQDIDDNRGSLILKKRDSVEPKSFEDFDLQMVIGRGAFGKVFLAKLKKDESKSEKLYAIKAIRKDVLIKH